MEASSLEALTALETLLSPDEIMIRDTARKFVADRVLPGIGGHFEMQTFPDEIIPQLREMGWLGIHSDGYGCAGRAKGGGHRSGLDGAGAKGATAAWMTSRPRACPIFQETR